jgi:hypothetical protein
MRIRFVLPALMIGAGMLLAPQTPAQAKTYHKQSRKARKFKGKRSKAGKGKHKTHNVRH